MNTYGPIPDLRELPEAQSHCTREDVRDQNLFVCSECGQLNEDRYDTCRECGAPRS